MTTAVLRDTVGQMKWQESVANGPRDLIARAVAQRAMQEFRCRDKTMIIRPSTVTLPLSLLYLQTDPKSTGIIKVYLPEGIYCVPIVDYSAGRTLAGALHRHRQVRLMMSGNIKRLFERSLNYREIIRTSYHFDTF